MWNKLNWTKLKSENLLLLCYLKEKKKDLFYFSLLLNQTPIQSPLSLSPVHVFDHRFGKRQLSCCSLPQSRNKRYIHLPLKLPGATSEQTEDNNIIKCSWTQTRTPSDLFHRPFLQCGRSAVSWSPGLCCSSWMCELSLKTGKFVQSWCARTECSCMITASGAADLTWNRCACMSKFCDT